jgi:hypothetical protein
MRDTSTAELRGLATDFRTAIERSIAEKATPHLPYFPDGACRLVSSDLALYLSQRGFSAIRFRQGAIPGHDTVRHTWLVVDGAVVDPTADPLGQPAVIVATASAFHDSLRAPTDQDALGVLAALSPDVAARNQRFLAQIEARLPERPGTAGRHR